MECQTSDPISSNQIVEVGLRKPKCVSFSDNTLNDWLKWIVESICCLKDDCEETVVDLVVGSSWDTVRQPKMYKKGNYVQLSGEVTGGDVNSVIMTLPFTPTHRWIVPLAHEFDPADLTDYQVFLKIDVDRSVKLYFTGTAPTGISSKLYLDGVSLFTE
jgi:hypothetical protein